MRIQLFLLCLQVKWLVELMYWQLEKFCTLCTYSTPAYWLFFQEISHHHYYSSPLSIQEYLRYKKLYVSQTLIFQNCVNSLRLIAIISIHIGTTTCSTTQFSRLSQGTFKIRAYCRNWEKALNFWTCGTKNWKAFCSKSIKCKTSRICLCLLLMDFFVKFLVLRVRKELSRIL